MASVTIGRVGFVPKGDYAAATTYEKYDIVTYNGSNYVAQAASTGVTPGSDATKWKLFIDNSAAATATAAANAAATNAANAVSYIADAYSTSGTYDVGDKVIYDGKLYRCNTAISTAEAWTAAHWTETQIGDDVTALENELDGDIYYHTTDTDVFGWKPGTRVNSSYKYANIEKYAAIYADKTLNNGYPKIYKGSSFTVSSGYTADYAIYSQNTTGSTRLAQQRNIAAGTTIALMYDGYLLLSVSDGSTDVDTTEKAEACAANGLTLNLITETVKDKIAKAVVVDDTLTQTGDAADAKVTGDSITEIKTAVDTDLYYHITDTDVLYWRPDVRVNSTKKNYTTTEHYTGLYEEEGEWLRIYPGSKVSAKTGYTLDYSILDDNNNVLQGVRGVAAGTEITLNYAGKLILSVSDGTSDTSTGEAAKALAKAGLNIDLVTKPIKAQVDVNATGVADLDKWGASVNNGAVLLMKRFVISKNVAKNTNYVVDTYLNEKTGEIRESSTGQNTSDYFMVKPNTTYYLTNGNTRICYYDINKKFIWGALKESGVTTHTSPINACYARMSTNVSPSLWNISEGNATIDIPYFEPYLADSEDELSPYYKGKFSIAKSDVSEWYECECLKENVNAFNFSLGTDTAYTGTQYADMIALYDQLVSDAETGYITKTSIGTGSGTDINGNAYTLYEYAFVPRAYTNANATKKHPKILIDCAIHGFEKNTAFAIFALMYDVVHNWTKSRFLETLRNSVEIRIVPVADPYGFDNNIRNNANGVNLNRNFPDENWESGSGSDYGGEEPLDQPEAAAIATWIQANTDMLMYFNLHVNGHYNAVGYGEANACMPRSGITDPYYRRLYNAIVRHIERQTAHLPEEFEALTPSYSQKIGQTQLSTHTGTSNQYVCDYLKTALAMTLEGCNYLKISDDVQMTMATGTVKLVAEIFGSMLEEILFEYLD